MKLGISLNIDVKKIDKAKIKDGKYLNLTVFVDAENKDKYGSNGGIFHQQSKEESDAKTNKIFVGNSKVFWSNSGTTQKVETKKTDNFFDDEGVF
jgi:hypothetical protein